MEAEMKVPSTGNPELTNVLPLKSGVGQNTIMYTKLTYC